MKRTPLKRTKGLSRKAGLRAKPPSKASTGQRSALDRMASEWCRAKGFCEAAEFYGTPCFGELTTHHISKRKHLRNRWNTRNLKCVCVRHHGDIEASRVKERAWIDATWPELWQELKDLEIGKSCLNYDVLETIWRARVAA